MEEELQCYVVDLMGDVKCLYWYQLQLIMAYKQRSILFFLNLYVIILNKSARSRKKLTSE